MALPNLSFLSIGPPTEGSLKRQSSEELPRTLKISNDIDAATREWLRNAPTVRTQLDDYGCAAILLTLHGNHRSDAAPDVNVSSNSTKVADFIEALDVCTANWFQSRIYAAYDATPSAEDVVLDAFQSAMLPMLEGKEYPEKIRLHAVLTPQQVKKKKQQEGAKPAEGPTKAEQNKSDIIMGKSILVYVTVNLGNDSFKDAMLDGVYTLFRPDAASSRTRLFDHKQWLPSIKQMVETISSMDRFSEVMLSERQRACLVSYCMDIVYYVRSGDVRMAQGAMTSAWLSNGFGLWAHLHPEIGLQANEFVRRVLWYEFGMDTILTGPSHMVYKAENGGSLDGHHDAVPSRKLILNLKQHLGLAVDAPAYSKAEDALGTNVSQWTKKYGFQALAHLDGGKSVPGTDPNTHGQTYIIGPMNCQILLWCMEYLHALATYTGDAPAILEQKKIAFADDDTRARFETGTVGPYFCNWKGMLPHLNDHVLRLTEQHGMPNHPPLTVMPIEHMTAPPNIQNLNGFVAMWPHGFPHGSLPNKQSRRVTVGINLRFRRPGQTVDEKVQQWYRSLATIADPAASDKAWQSAETTLCRLFESGFRWADGGTHADPERAIKWITAAREDRDAWWTTPTKLLPPQQLALYRNKKYGPKSGVAGFFQAVAPTPAVVESFLHEMNQQWMSDAATHPSSPRAQAAASTAPASFPAPLPLPLPVPLPSVPVPQPVLPLSSLPSVAPRPNLVAKVRKPKELPNQWDTLPPNPKWPDLYESDFRCLNVQQPWASAIVYKLKNVENRSGSINQRACKANFWALIVASGNVQKDSQIDDLRVRAQTVGSTDALNGLAAVLGHRPLSAERGVQPMWKQSIVGIARFVGSWQKGDPDPAFEPYRDSIWFNGNYAGSDDYAWCIQDALYLGRPITDITGRETPFWSVNGKPPNNGHPEKDRIMRELQANGLYRYDAKTNTSAIVDMPDWDLPSDPPAAPVPLYSSARAPPN